MAKAAKKKAAPKKAAKKAAKKAIKKAAKKAAPAKKVVTAAPATEGALAKRLAELEHEVGILQDKNEIKELHYKYGYYIDKCMWREAVDLFADKDSEVRFANGIYKGKAGAFRLYVGWMQLIIDPAPDRKTAKMRGRGFLIGGVHKSKKDPIVGVPNQFLEGGVYENIYVKENGVWKIKLLDYNMLWQADYEPGVYGSEAHIPPLTKTYPEDPNGPDELKGDVPFVWPKTRVVPFHYPHPVTGKMWKGKIKGIGK
jgi:hypothetical protein